MPNPVAKDSTSTKAACPQTPNSGHCALCRDRGPNDLAGGGNIASDDGVRLVLGRQAHLFGRRPSQDGEKLREPIRFRQTVNVSRIEIKLHLFLFEKVAVQPLFAEGVRGANRVIRSQSECLCNIQRRRSGLAVHGKRHGIRVDQQGGPNARPVVQRRVEDVDVSKRTIVLEVRGDLRPIHGTR